MFSVDREAIEATGRRSFFCNECRDERRDHRVQRLHIGYTREDSPWGYGWQQWMLRCTSCERIAGPFVESDDVDQLPDIENRRRLARDQAAGGSHRSLTMSTLTMKPKPVKEPRPKRQLAPLAMQQEMHSRRADVVNAAANQVLEGMGLPATVGRSPDETGTTTPAGIRRNDPEAQLEDLGLLTKTSAKENGHAAAAAAKELRNFGSKTTSKVSLKNCVRHPDNRVPTQQEIDDMAATIKVDGLLEKPVLRPIAGGKYQIVSGETRVLAMRKLGWHEADAELVQCDDARALELLAIYNAKRTDLNPIQKARMIERLCKSKEEGGSGLTREAAGKIYKLESHSAASNLVRLLELPEIWQNRVAAGELPESFARVILPLASAPRLLAELDKSWKAKDRDEDWGSRDRVETNVDYIMEELTRPLDGEKHRYGYKELQRVKNHWRLSGEYKRLFELTPEIEAKLEIVELLVDGKKVRRATNAPAYDKLQIPLIVKAVDAKAKTSAEKSSRDKAAKREPTPAERKEQAAARTRQLGERIAAWRHKLLRRACAKAIEDQEDSGLRVVLAHAADRVSYGGLSFTEALLQVRGVKPSRHGWHDEYWPVVAGIQSSPAQDDDRGVIAKLAQLILSHESKDWRRPTLPHSFVDSYAHELSVDLKAEWTELQNDELNQEPDPMLEEFFLLHQTEQLRGLAKELGVFADESANKPAIVKLLLGKLRGGSNSRLPLPKNIKPLGKKGGK